MASAPLPEQFDTAVVVYVTPWCPYCRMALRLLERRSIVPSVVDVTGDHEARAWLRARSGQGTVPQVFIRGRSVGGFDELSALDADGELGAAVAGG